MQEWLVEISTYEFGSPTIDYETVTASNQFEARYRGVAQFKERLKYTPSLRRKLDNEGIDIYNIKGSDAVAIP